MIHVFEPLNANMRIGGLGNQQPNMKAKLFSRTIAVILLGAVLGFGLHRQTETFRLAGREAFMAEKARRWDQGYARPPSLTAELLVCISTAALAAGAYEIIAAALSRALWRPESKETNPAQTKGT
jgi:hypothetical protein